MPADAEFVRGEAAPIPHGFFAQFWQLFGLKKRDTLTALFALPAGVQVLTQLYDSLHLSDLLRRFIRVWREVTRALWEQAAAFLNTYIPWKLDFTPAEQDALTLATLAGGAALTSVIFRRGESLARLSNRVRPYPWSVKVAGGFALMLVILATAAMFLSFAGSEQILSAQGFQIIAPFLGAILLFASAHWAIFRDGRKIELAATALLRSDFALARSHVARFRKGIEHEWQKKGFMGKSPLETASEGDVPSLIAVMREWHGRQARVGKVVMPLLGLVLLMIVFYLTTSTTGRVETAVAYLVAIAALIACTAINWKAFPIIYANVLLITLLNYGTLALTPAVQHLDGLIRQAGG